MRRALRYATAQGLVALLLAGCEGRFSIPPQPREQVVAPAGDTITIAPNGTETIQPPQQSLCLARARGFRGLVPMDCGLAQSVRP